MIEGSLLNANLSERFDIERLVAINESDGKITHNLSINSVL